MNVLFGVSDDTAKEPFAAVLGFSPAWSPATLPIELFRAIGVPVAVEDGGGGGLAAMASMRSLTDLDVEAVLDGVSNVLLVGGVEEAYGVDVEKYFVGSYTGLIGVVIGGGGGGLKRLRIALMALCNGDCCAGPVFGPPVPVPHLPELSASTWYGSLANVRCRRPGYALTAVCMSS